MLPRLLFAGAAALSTAALRSRAPVRICVVACPGSFDFGAMLEEFLGAASPRVKVTVLDAASGALPEPPAFDAVLVSGSRCGTYDPEPWIPPLIDCVRSLLDRNVRVLGVCFGHQVLAEALGGRSQPNPRGWGVGRRGFSLAPGMEEALVALAARCGGGRPHEAGRLWLQYTHGDAVEAGAPGPSLGGTEHAPVLGFYEPGRFLSVQGHPEFSAATMRALLDVLEPRGVMEKLADGGTRAGVEAALDLPVDAEFIGRAMVGFAMDG